MFASNKRSHSGRTISLSLLGFLPLSRTRLRERCEDEFGRKTSTRSTHKFQVPCPQVGRREVFCRLIFIFQKNRKPLKKQLVRCVYFSFLFVFDLFVFVCFFIIFYVFWVVLMVCRDVLRYQPLNFDLFWAFCSNIRKCYSYFCSRPGYRIAIHSGHS